MKALLSILGGLLLATGPVRAVGPVITYRDKPWEQLSDKELTDWGQAALKIEGRKKWQHGETDHFVIHCFRSGDKVGNRSEAFYAKIREFFGYRPDLLAKRKSHLFAFHERADWDRFCRAVGQSGIDGVTRNHEFFYLATGDDGRFDSKAKVQAHEMTHLVFNRFFAEQPPLWLNEGIAEYFGQRETSTTAEFRDLMSRTAKFPLDQLFAADGYPRDVEAMEAFYAESAIVVDFLTKSLDRRALLPKFVEALIGENDVAKALRIYQYKDLTEFEAAYGRYRKSRF